MNEPSQRLNLNQHQREELAAVRHQHGAAAPLEFATAEELLRHDAAQIEVPGVVAERLAESIKTEPAAPTWWQRMFKG